MEIINELKHAKNRLDKAAEELKAFEEGEDGKWLKELRRKSRRHDLSENEEREKARMEKKEERLENSKVKWEEQEQKLQDALIEFDKEKGNEQIAPKLTAENVKSILNSYIQPPDDPLRQSLANFLNIPDDVSDISSHLMFVDRYEEIKNLMRNMKNLHNLINNLDNIPEPKKHVMFTTAVGTAGKGKTTFARRAYYEKDIYLNVIGEGLSNVVQECLYAGRNFRIDCSSFEGEELKIDMESEKPFGKRLLYEALKYHLRGKTIDEFFKILGEFSIDLVDILKLILEYHPCKQDWNPLFIINIDETNVLFEHGKASWLKRLLYSISNAICKGYFIFVILTGTHASNLFELVKSSGAKIYDIALPLLKPEHAQEVILELANRGLREDSKERVTKLSPYLEVHIRLLGVVGRFLESMMFEMAILGWAAQNDQDVFGEKFHYEGFRYFLRNMQYQSEHCRTLLLQTQKHIDKKYHRYFKQFEEDENRDLVPELVAYTLFEWPVDRTTTLGKRKRSVEELEKKDMLFLDGDSKIKLPFITLAHLYGLLNPNHIAKVRLLDSLDSALSWGQAEYLTLSVIVFKLWAIHRRLVTEGEIKENDEGYCQLSELVPLRENQSDIRIRFPPWFVIRKTEHRVNKESWQSFYLNARSQSTNEVLYCMAFLNCNGAQFPDTFLTTKPPIFVQEKSSQTSNKNAVEGKSALMFPSYLLKTERDKCPDEREYIFIISTDYKERGDVGLGPKNNEVLITRENRKAMFGELLTLRKLYCLESL
ncbi:13138_t:CDS:2 [Funneliformis caledonium]|uniref:13138_t:CDS:1 n=1 Tax=Funneliformis caledonium TaxID=1117310 RepID=A0A9N9FYX3_9GLOM|nr:13138_t:CDS:2 [Funneliformis caledonium]